MRVEFLSSVAPATSERLVSLSHIALVGNALPRRCGLATYSSHSADALRAVVPEMRIDHYAMDDGEPGVAYPDTLAGLLPQGDRDAYLRAARDIDDSGAQLIWVQHEFGIYGGRAGAYLLDLVERSTLPVVTSLHTILTDPDPDQDRVFRRLLARSAKLVVMAEAGRTMLVDHYGIDADRIMVVEHGAPDRSRIDPAEGRARIGLAERPTILTFGLLAPGKGIELMIEAMAHIVHDIPEARYIVLGATHPALLRREGEAYRESLRARVAELGLDAAVEFVDRFVEEDELLDWLQAADAYVTPYPNLRQITSGTLSYAVAMGLPVVASPYVHARELLAGDTGILIESGAPEDYAAALSRLLGDAAERDAYSRRAYARGRRTLWDVNARSISATMQAALAEQPVRRTGWQPVQPSLDGVIAMTDDTGILQHSSFAVADRSHGYCIDDNARLLILVVRWPEDDPRAAMLARRAAAFVQHGWNADAGVFRNFMGFDRQWLEERGSDDSQGRALWALGVAAGEARDPGLADWGRNWFDRCIGSAAALDGSPRALAFAMLGAASVLRRDPAAEAARALLVKGADLLANLVDAARRPDWAWFEAVLAYDNARLPEALLVAGECLGRDDLVALGLETLRWIVDVQTGPKGRFRAVGTDSFGREYAPPLPFDQQPLEAHATVEACCTAARISGDASWLDEADRALAWFAGANDLGLPLAGPEPGGCRDGLTPAGVNRNSGAESILALQLAACARRTVRRDTGQVAA